MSGVLANTGGIPLAFMFYAALGIQGKLTQFIKYLGWDIYADRFLARFFYWITNCLSLFSTTFNDYCLLASNCFIKK
jgi:ABC-type uncharacterized transport system permease subunit